MVPYSNSEDLRICLHSLQASTQPIVVTSSYIMLGLGYVFTAIAALMPQVFAQTCATINPANAPTFASGYSGRVVMNGLKTPRGIIFDNEGNILTTEQGGYGVRYIQLTDNGGTNVCVKSSKQLISDSSVRAPQFSTRCITTRLISLLGGTMEYSCIPN